MNRREFVQSTVVASAALGMGSLSSQAAASVSASGVSVVFDPRYSDARAFSQTFERLGASSFAVGPVDVVALWRSHLRVMRPRAIAGLTTHSDLEVVRECASEIGLKLQCEIFHDSRGRETVQHRITRGGSATLIRQLARSGAAWPAALASVMTDGSSEWATISAPVLSAPKAADHPGTLVSWLLA
jgi:hypothetical protein